MTAANIIGASAIGNINTPIYFDGATFRPINFYIAKSVPANAVFTDTQLSKDTVQSWAREAISKATIQAYAKEAIDKPYIDNMYAGAITGNPITSGSFTVGAAYMFNESLAVYCVGIYNNKPVIMYETSGQKSGTYSGRPSNPNPDKDSLMSGISYEHINASMNGSRVYGINGDFVYNPNINNGLNYFYQHVGSGGASYSLHNGYIEIEDWWYGSGNSWAYETYYYYPLRIIHACPAFRMRAI